MRIPVVPIVVANLLIALPPAAFAADAAPQTWPTLAPPTISQPQFPNHTFNVKDSGATGDAATNDTAAINRAIAAANAAGGGTVEFPPGTYSAASIHLLSHVRLKLDPAATIIGAKGAFEAPEPNPYSKYQDGGHSHFHNSLMWGENLEDVEITGGKINGGPAVSQGDKDVPGQGNKIIAIKVGSNLHFDNIIHDTGGHFVYLLNDCTNITIDHVTIKKSRDAIDLMGCSNVAVHDCHFTGCVDDTLGIKSDWALGKKINSANIYAWDDYFESGCNGVQFGSETAGDFHNVNVWNIQIGLAMKAGLGITSCDGAVVDGVRFDHITIRHAANPIYILVNNRLRSGDPNVKVGSIRNVVISNVDITDMSAGRQGGINPATLSGMPDGLLQHITLQNIHIHYPGNGTADEANIIPPYPRDYSPKAMGPRPASAFFIRNAEDIRLQNVTIDYDHPDPRPPIVASNVNGLTLDHLNIALPPNADPVAVLHGVSQLQVIDSPQLATNNAIVQTPAPAEPNARASAFP